MSQSNATGGLQVRRLSVGLGAVALVVAFGWALSDSIGQMGEFDKPLGPPTYDEVLPEEPPPSFGPEPSELDRVRYYLSVLASGDSEDTAWAARQLRREGPLGRSELLAVATRSARTNTALLQQALVFLSEAPDVDTVPLARTALESRDPNAVQRGIQFLGLLGGDPAVEAVPQIVELARTRANPIPFHAIEFLGGLPHEAARDGLLALAQDGPHGFRGVAWAQLALHDSDAVRERLRAAFDAEADGDVKRYLAGALAMVGDPHPTDWLLGVHMRAAEGSGEFEHAQRALAHLAHGRALQVIESRLADEFDDAARLLAVTQLEHFPREVRLRLLEPLLERGAGLDVRVHAWEQWIELGRDPRERALLELLGRPGAESWEDRKVALLVLGRLRRPEHVPALLAALAGVPAHGRHSLEERGYLLRALALIGDARAAPQLVAAVAADRTPFDGQVMDSTAYQLWQVLGTADAELSRALAEELLGVLQGDTSELGGAGLSHLLLMAGAHGDQGHARYLAPFLEHASRHVRDSAILALMNLGGPAAGADLAAAWRRPQPDPTRALLRVALERVHYLPR